MITVSAPDRPPATRRDAQRNRQRIIEAATRAFTTDRDPEPMKMEDIAQAAGVGIGTLYRNFPSREALVEEVYRTELTRLCALAPDLLATSPPADALREWMHRYQDFVATKRGMADALRAAMASGAITSAKTRDHLNAAIATILTAGQATDTLRTDIDPADISAAMAGLMLTATTPTQATRLLDLLVDALMTR
jgi:AcrR family transcriptional regulator